jgi:hypothetical protein
MQAMMREVPIRELAAEIRTQLAAPYVSGDALCRAIQGAPPIAQAGMRALFPNLMQEVRAAVSPGEWARIATLLP